uniref:RxLR effector candidate protein n=1 Tax=Hyaloperonospora arabidopsidis (strain Emoy2) TaxID=559515 RepID=M4C2L7_HYAAE
MTWRWLNVLLTPLVAFQLLAYTEAEGVESAMEIVGSDRTVKLDPSVQHIPLDPAKANMRPPPAQIPAVSDIFVGISVFRDGLRCGKTIFTGLKRAKYPDRLSFGIVDQVNDGDERCLDEYCKMAQAEWPDKGECPYKDHIRVDLHSASGSRGPTLARHFQQKLIQQEEFCLQLDGHSIFTNLWDENLLAEWKRVDNEMAILSTYLHHLHDFIKKNGDNAFSTFLPHLCSTMRSSNGMLQALWGAGMSFNKCHAERRVPVDSHTLWLFDGEEFLRAARLWTSGYDMYSPSNLGSVVFHNYSKVPARFQHMTVDPRIKHREREMAFNRFNLLVGKPIKGLVDTFELDKYGYGPVRSFESYLKFCGVTFQEGQNDADSCEQLHWVPYENETEVEALVGNGWKMGEKNKGVTAKSALLTKEHAVVDEDPNAEVAQQEADAHLRNGADIGEDETVIEADTQLRQKVTVNRASRGLSAALIWAFLVFAMAAVFVRFSKDSVSRKIRLICACVPLSHSSIE